MNEREIIVSEADIAVDGFLYQLQLTPSSFLWNLKYLQLRNGTLVSFKNVCLIIIILILSFTLFRFFKFFLYLFLKTLIRFLCFISQY